MRPCKMAEVRKHFNMNSNFYSDKIAADSKY